MPQLCKVVKLPIMYVNVLTGMYSVLFLPFTTVVRDGDFIELKRQLRSCV